jgi:hypothetical protein
MKGRTLTIIVLIALIILAPLVFRPKDAVAPVKNADNQMKESFQFGGNPDDLISFSIKHGQEVSGKFKVAGERKSGRLLRRGSHDSLKCLWNPDLLSC